MNTLLQRETKTENGTIGETGYHLVFSTTKFGLIVNRSAISWQELMHVQPETLLKQETKTAD